LLAVQATRCAGGPDVSKRFRCAEITADALDEIFSDGFDEAPGAFDF
jgi:hypothetical protein